MIKYIVLACIFGVLVTVAYKKEQQAFNDCLLTSSYERCNIEMAGG